MRKGLLVVLACFLSGCATASFTGYKDPAYIDHPGFSKTLVHAYQMNLEEREVLETKVVKEFERKGVVAVRAMDLLPPTRSWTTEQVAAILNDNNIDAVLVITLEGQDVETGYAYIPGMTTTTGTVNTYGSTATYTGSSYTTGGSFTTRKPKAAYSVTLFDLKAGQSAWMASGNAKGDGAVSFKELTRMAGLKLVKKLFDDGLYKSN